VGRTEDSIAEALGKAHVALLTDLGGLDQAVHTSSEEGLVALRARLEATSANLTKHFRSEEQNGYMDVIRKREPRLERTIQQLAEEHGQLRQSLDALIEEAGAATGVDDALRNHIRELIARVRQHEIRENDLVQEAFNLDISAED
jgi:iron-sulfur cluster repair protein YtfE (RIC family)